ncbi:helix-turn-helix domain-containing protein [Rhodobacterales bacterium]|nr:helix-turn-helix domain-containing protein [Rhodobacterales bacterium]
MAHSEQTCAGTSIRVPNRVWDTVMAPPDEAFDYFREGVCASFMPLRPELARERRQGFRGRLTSYDLGTAALNVITAPAYEIFRGGREIAASGDDCLYLNYQLAGHCRIEQLGRSVPVAPGAVAAFDGSEPFRLDITARETHKVASVLLPKKQFPALTDALSSPGCSALSERPAFGSLLTEAFRALIRSADTGPKEQVGRLFDVLVNSAILAAQNQNGSSVEPGGRKAALLRRLKDLVSGNCPDANFSPQHCADLAGISAGYLHQVFAAHGETFGSYLLECRLEGVASLLRNPDQQHLPVSTIALRCGFKDLSHFGRAFRRHYGSSPGRWRKGNDAN